MDSRPDLSILIVSYQVREHLARCLNSIANAKTEIGVEVFVVDNASSDGSAELVREDFTWVCLLANRQNMGFAAANNQALRESHGRFLLLLNPDTVIPEKQPNALDTLIAFMRMHPRAGACGPKLLYGDGTLQHSAFRFPSLAQIYLDLFPTHWRLAESRLNGRYPKRLYSAGPPFEVDHPLGAALMVRREAAEQVGWLDEGFFIYVEEIDWCLRIKRAGWEIWCVPQAEIIHLEAQSTRQFRDQLFVELWRARFRFFRKHYSRPFNVAAAWLVRVGMRVALSKAERAFRRGQLSPAEWQPRRAAFTAVARLAREGADAVGRRPHAQ